MILTTEDIAYLAGECRAHEAQWFEIVRAASGLLVVRFSTGDWYNLEEFLMSKGGE